MAKMTGRLAILVFVGGVDLVFGMLLTLMGANSVVLFDHGAVGVPMWTGILLVLVGLGNFIAVATSKPKEANEYMSINFGSLLLNLAGALLACILIGFYVWGAYDEVLNVGSSNTVIPGKSYTYQDLTSIFSTVILMAGIILVLSFLALFMDCCSFALFGNGGAPPPRYGPPVRHHSAMYDGPYGLPPQGLYKQ